MPPLEISDCHHVRQNQNKACNTQKKNATDDDDDDSNCNETWGIIIIHSLTFFLLSLFVSEVKLREWA